MTEVVPSSKRGRRRKQAAAILGFLFIAIYSLQISTWWAVETFVSSRMGILARRGVVGQECPTYAFANADPHCELPLAPPATADHQTRP